MADPRLAELPAEEDDFRAEQAGKIDQPGLGTVDDAAVAVDLLDELPDLTDQFRRGALLG